MLVYIAVIVKRLNQQAANLPVELVCLTIY